MLYGNIVKSLSLLLMLLSVTRGSLFDPSLQPITKKQLVHIIKQTDISSPYQQTIMSRAYISGLSNICYQQYLIILKQNQQNFYANLNLGMAAKMYWQSGMVPTLGKVVASQSSQKVLEQAANAFNNALKLRHTSAITLAELGSLLFYSGNQAKGVMDLHKAVLLSPENPRILELMGDINAGPNPPYYNADKAVQELDEAIQIAPQDSYPHWVLASLYLLQHKNQEAQKEIQEYKRMIPPGGSPPQYILQFEKLINN